MTRPPEPVEHTPAFKIRNALLTITRCWAHMLPTSPAVTTAGTIGRHATTSRPPVADHIIDARLLTLGYLATWACRVAYDKNLKGAIPEHDPYVMAKMLGTHADYLATITNADGGTAVAHLEEAARKCQGIAEPHDALKFAGTCDACGGDLMGDSKTARCKECKAVVDGPTQQERIREQVRDRLMTRRELLDLSPLVGKRLHPTQFDRWVKSGKIAQHTTSADGKPLYPVSDFLDLLIPDRQLEAS